MRDPRSIAVIGVTGYTGFELATLLLRHPEIQPPTFYVRETNGFHCLSQLFPQLRARAEAPLRSLTLDAVIASNAGTAFLATPHEASAEYVPQLRDAALRVIDLSGAFRFSSAETFSNWYKLPTPHADRLGDAVYGLPEFYADQIRKADLVVRFDHLGKEMTGTAASLMKKLKFPPKPVNDHERLKAIARGSHGGRYG